MFGKLKKYFIPHEANDHKPHLLRPRAVAFVCLVAIIIECAFLFGSSYVVPRVKLLGVIFVNALIDGTNHARVAADLPALRENALLDAAAQEKANDMAANDYFAHTSPSGLTPWYWFWNVGYNFNAAGENLAVDFADSSDVTTAWLNSPEHRANIMNAGFVDIGMATAQGEFDGHPTVYIVELFGTPAASVGQKPVAAASPLVVTSTASAASEQTFVAVKGAQTAETTSAAVVSAAPVPTETPSASPTLAQSALADPRRTVDYFYFAIVILFAVALLLNIFIKVRVQHPQVILGGMLVILLTGLIIVLNQHFVAGGAVVL